MKNVGYLAPAALLFFGALIARLYTWNFRRNARQVIGRVSERKFYLRSGVKHHSPVVTFTLDGVERKFASPMSGTGCPELGSQITVFVDPNDPENVVLDGWDRSNVLAGVLFIGGVVLLFLGLTVE